VAELTRVTSQTYKVSVDLAIAGQSAALRSLTDLNTSALTLGSNLRGVLTTLQSINGAAGGIGGSRARTSGMNEEAAAMRALRNEANAARNFWQADRMNDAQTVAGMQKYNQQATVMIGVLEGQIAALKAKGVLNVVEEKELQNLIALQNGYSVTLKTTASTLNAISGQITKGSLAAGVSAGVRDAANAVALLNNQYKAGTISTAEYTSGLTVQRSALLGNLTAVQLETVALRELGVLSAQDASRLAVLVTEEQRLTAAAAQTTAALERQAAAQRAAAGAALGVRGAGGLNGAAIGLSFVDPTLGMAAMALSMGPVIAGLAAIGLGLKAFGDGIDKAAIFQRSLAQIGGISGETAEQMNHYGAYIQNLSTILPVATQKLAEMGREAVMVGLHGPEGMKVYTENMAAFAVITRTANGELGHTAEVGQEVVKILRSTGANTEEVTVGFGRMINGLVGLKTESGVAIPQVTALLKFWSSQGHAVGLTIEQMTGLSAALIQTGARAQGAGGAMAKFFDTAESAAATGGAKLQAWANVIGLSAQQTRELLKNDPMAFLQRFVTGAEQLDRGGKALSLTLGSVSLNSAQVRRTMAELNNALPLVSGNIKIMTDASNDQGLALRKAVEATNDYKDKVTLLSHGFDVLKVNMGMAVLPGMTAVLGWALNLSTALKDASQAMSGTLGAAAGIDTTKLSAADAADVELTLKAIRRLQTQTDEGSKKQLADAQAHLEVLKQIAAGTWKGATPWAAQNSQQAAGLFLPTPGNIVPGGSRSAVTQELGLPGSNRTGTPFGGKYFGGQVHNGEDFFAPVGTPLTAAFTGFATTRWSKTTGHIIELIDATGQKMLLGHLNGYADGLEEAIKKAGGKLLVKQGQLIGYVGQTGSLAHADLGPGNAHTHVMGYDAKGNIINPLTAKFQNVGSEAPTPPPDEQNKPLSAYVAEVERLQAAIDKAAKRGKPGLNDWKEAKDDLNAFTEANKDMVAQANDWISSQTKRSKQALKDMGLSDADWAKYKARATELAALQDKRSTLSQPQALKLDRDMASFNSDPVKSKALEFASQQLSDRKALEAQNKQEADKAAAESRRVSQALNQGRVSDAQAALERLKTIQQQELDSAGDSQSKRLAVVKKTSQQIYEAEMAVARVTRRDAIAAANEEKNPALRSAQIGRANSAYTLTDQKAQLERIQAVQAAQKSADSEHDQRVKTAGENQLKADQALADGKSALAKTSAQAVLTAYDLETAKAGSSASQKLLTEQAWQSKRLAAMNTLSRAEAQASVTNLEQERNKLVNAEGVTKAQRQELWAQYAERIGKIDAGLTVTLKANQQTVKTDLQRAKDEQLKVVQDNVAKVNASLADVLANPGQYGDGARGLTTPFQVGLEDLLKLLPTTDAEAQKFLGTVEDMAQQGLISGSTLEAMKAHVAAVGVEARVAAGEFKGITDGGRDAAAASSDLRLSMDTLNEVFPATLAGADGFGKALDEWAASGAITNEMLTTMKARLDALRESLSFDAGLVEEQARNGAFNDVSDGGRNPKGKDFQPLDPADQNKNSFDLSALSETANALPYKEFQQFLKDIQLSQEDTDTLTASWRAFNDQVQATLDTVNKNPDDYADGARGLTPKSGSADELQRQIDEDRARGDRDLAAQAEGAKQSAEATTTLAGAYAALKQAQGETVGSNQGMIDSLNQLWFVAGVDTKALGELIGKLKQLDQQAKDKANLDAFAQGLQQIGGTLSQLDGLGGLFGKTLSSIGSGIQLFQKIPDLMSKTSSAMKGGSIFDLAGAAGGWLGMASEAINLIGSLGDAIMNLDPGYQKWKKNMLEIASLESQSAGSKKTGLISNPYYDALQEDSQKRQTLANAGFWQKLGWSLFGGAPEAMSDAAANMLSKASTIFSDLGSKLSSSLSSNLLKAVKSGDFSTINDTLKAEMDDFVTQAVIDEVIAKSNLTALIKQYADDSAAGRDTSSSLAAIRNEESRITGSVSALSGSLPSFGNTPGDSSAGTSSGSAFGTQAQAIEFTLPSVIYDGFTGFDASVSLFSTTITDARAMYQEVRQMYQEVGVMFKEGLGINLNLAQGTTSMQASTTAALR